MSLTKTSCKKKEKSTETQLGNKQYFTSPFTGFILMEERMLPYCLNMMNKLANITKNLSSKNTLLLLVSLVLVTQHMSLQKMVEELP